MRVRVLLTRTLIGAVGLVGLLGGALFAFVRLRGNDLPAVEDGDMRLAPLAVPDEANAFTHFHVATTALNVPPALLPGSHEDIGGLALDTQRVTELLQRNRSALHYFEQGLACTECRLPAAGRVADVAAFSRDAQTLARLVAMETFYLFGQDKQREAFARAVQLVRLGHMVQGCQGGVAHYLIGLSIEEAGLSTIRVMLPVTSLAPEVLRACQDELFLYREHETGLVNSIRAEYTLAAALVEDMAAGRRGLGGLTDTGTPLLHTRFRHYVFHPNRTRGMLLAAFRAAVADVPRAYSGITFSDAAWARAGATSRREVFLPNIVGRVLYTGLLPPLERAYERKCRADLSGRATRLLIALRNHDAAARKIPASLQELAPDYIEAAPQDPFDGQPLRYLPATHQVYSIGPDLRDDEGRPESRWDLSPARRKGPGGGDITFGISF